MCREWCHLEQLGISQINSRFRLVFSSCCSPHRWGIICGLQAPRSVPILLGNWLDGLDVIKSIEFSREDRTFGLYNGLALEQRSRDRGWSSRGSRFRAGGSAGVAIGIERGSKSTRAELVGFGIQSIALCACDTARSAREVGIHVV